MVMATDWCMDRLMERRPVCVVVDCFYDLTMLGGH